MDGSEIRFNKMTPQEKYGPEFLYKPFTFKKADGKTFNCHDVCVCIRQKEDKQATLTYGWGVLRELALWVIDSFPTAANNEGFRLIIAWSKSVRPMQGHIFKIFQNIDHVRTIPGFSGYEDYAKIHGNSFVPLRNWEKDVFK